MKKESRIYSLIIMTLVSGLMMSGCSLTDLTTNVTDSTGIKSDSLIVSDTVGSYDSMDTAIIKAINRDTQSITFQNMESGKDYTLTYDETTTFQDKYGEALADTQVNCGDVADVTFMKTAKTLTTLKMSSTVWSYTEVTNFSIPSGGKSMYIGDTIYKLEDDYVVASNDKLIELMDINEKDMLTVYGIDQKIYSIVIEKGHGYVSLTNDSDFIGGFIEIGQSIIKPIKEGMLLVVPEGTYDVLITKDGSNGTMPLTVGRDEEVELDLNNIEIAATQYGTLTFTLTPANTELYFDNVLVEPGSQITEAYGLHQLVASADGYDTSTLYVNVGQASANLIVTLTASTDASTDTTKTTDTTDATDTTSDTTDATDSATASSNTGSTTGTDSTATDTADTTNTTSANISDYLVYIETPIGAEVYLDGNYLGIAPISFDKSTGNHVITLRKTGYQTRSYTIDVDSTAKDSSYSFADLTTIGQ